MLFLFGKVEYIADTMTDTAENTLSVDGLPKAKKYRWIKLVVFVLCLGPLVMLMVRALTGDLGANPIEVITRDLGDWALRLLLVTLAVTPVRQLTGWNVIGQLRRMLGLFAFFYVVLHLSSYVWLDQFFSWPDIWQDIVKRIYITLGMAAILILTPMAITSTDKMIKRLGGNRWRRLHRMAYPASILGVIHFFMMLKTDYTEPMVYAIILAGLFGVRIYKKWA